MQSYEVIELAETIIKSITNDLNASIYSEPNANLTVEWKRSDAFNASAIPKSKVTEPPIHIIEISYGLAISLYKDIDKYCSYLESGFDQEIFHFLLKEHPHKSLLPTNLTPEEYRKNMFISALTWVYFHELAHLNQEHVYILNQLLNTNQYSKYTEFDIDNSKSLKGEAANIHHVLELAADFEAIQTCIYELITHFNGNELRESIGTFVSGISCAIYKIHNLDMLDLNSEITGSHPPPIVRLEQILPQIWETFDLLEQHKIIYINLNRIELVHKCDISARTAGFFWFRKEHIHPDKLKDFLHCGTVNRVGGKEYLQAIINTWDEIKDEINKNKRDTEGLRILTFTEQYRDLVFGNVN